MSDARTREALEVVRKLAREKGALPAAKPRGLEPGNRYFSAD